MNTPEFAGPALPLTDADIAAAAAELGVEPALIAAVAEVESASAGFLRDKRPKILFEAHIFSRRTGHRYDDSHPNISSPTWNRALYGASGAHQYERLHEAIALDRKAALESASFGRFQIMGFNAAACGFPDVEAFVDAMRQSEAEHLKAFIAFCRSNNLLRHLIVHNWRAFTAGYNGTGQVDRYSALLEAAYQEHAAKAPARPPPQPFTPGVAVTPIGVAIAEHRRAARALQIALKAEGHDPGPIDGVFGKRSNDALAAYLRTQR